MKGRSKRLLICLQRSGIYLQSYQDELMLLNILYNKFVINLTKKTIPCTSSKEGIRRRRNRPTVRAMHCLQFICFTYSISIKEGSKYMDLYRFQEVNKVIKFPIPRIIELLLSRAHYITKLDFSKRNYRIPISAEYRDKTVFFNPLVFTNLQLCSWIGI